jgi:hypothetical protein
MIPREIESEFGAALRTLNTAGYRVVRSGHDAAAFGNWFVHLEGRRSFQVVKDRGQFMVFGAPDLHWHGLDRTFDNLAEFIPKLLTWAG